MKIRGKLNMRIISKSVLMLFTKKYQNWSMLVETTACQKVGAFLRHSVFTKIIVKYLTGNLAIANKLRSGSRNSPTAQEITTLLQIYQYRRKFLAMKTTARF